MMRRGATRHDAARRGTTEGADPDGLEPPRGVSLARHNALARRAGGRASSAPPRPAP